MESLVEQTRTSQNESMMSIDSPSNSFSNKPSALSTQTQATSMHSITSTPTSITTFQVTRVYRATYLNVEVIEMEVNGNPVMRRLKDSYFNATQILKLAGLDRTQRSKLLENEICQGQHEKVQGGSGRYQGTWIPYSKALELCRRYDVYEVMKPLLLYNPTTSNDITPTKDQLKRSFSSMSELENLNGNRNTNNIINSQHSNTNSFHSKGTSSTPASRSNTYPDTQPDDQHSPKKLKFESNELHPIEIFDHETKLDNPNSPFTMKPMQEDEFDEKSKVVMSSLFLPSQKDLSLLELVGNDESQLDGISIDAPIDDNGQTALHLAATLGRLTLVRDLVKRGSNRIRGDNDGQTALVRAVHATNCFENSCFDKLLDYMYPAITVLDHKGRTVLHHIAYTCGRKGRNDACKYYLETLLEWVVKRGPSLPDNQSLSLTKFMQDVVNIPDRNGDTCLNIAAMVGNKHIIQQLLEVGADPNRANKAGVKPIDCGIDLEVPNQSSSRISSAIQNAALMVNKNAGNSSFKDSNQNHNNNPAMSNVHPTFGNSFNNSGREPSGASLANNNGFPEKKSSLSILNSIQTFVSQLGKDFQEEMDQKNKQINGMHPQLREKTLKLSEKRKQFDELQKIVRKLSDYKTKIINLNKAIDEEESKFKEQTKELPVSSANFAGDFDADEPFTVWSVYNEIETKVEKILSERQQQFKQQQLDSTESQDNKDKNNNRNANGESTGQGKQHTPPTELDTVEIINSLKAEDLLPSLSKTQSRQLLPPSVVLEARINAYKKNNESLIERTKSRRSSSQELEQQFKRVIALCIGSKPEDIDERLLGSLLLSVENDPDPEINQIKKVLKIVNDLEDK
ncbi:unnamed protein product [Ambrosiozyma monospora]|uniref:Unnamed protein product n=1 Tax=Ambrosiozyma monospora TaxID=43982 RepID=A0A9W6YYB5_AMBMO|nr:unnamed protein product [Ambrosiozyma monospora]